jgi:hypothetical protein
MSGVGIWIGVAGVGFVAMNVATTRRIWRSAAFERSQKIAQTALVWLLPGSFILVGAVLSERPPKQLRDPTVHEAAQIDPTGVDVGHDNDPEHPGP